VIANVLPRIYLIVTTIDFIIHATSNLEILEVRLALRKVLNEPALFFNKPLIFASRDQKRITHTRRYHVTTADFGNNSLGTASDFR